ncbi:ferredoxin [Plantactinospora sp. BB1]|uniref:ferredoxin n=1 Tax=Plantactinospora sp. BB1 TaxID=2071627 RepID=UPI000D166FA2|nr:ferredoxin [Plantactinospora sp. BB1]AVT35846.1 ferredoxin [Plantactinospora sp. BB1]
MRITADLERCVGAGQCVLTEPAVFDQNDDDGTVIVLRATADDDETIRRVREAVHLCPSQALTLTEPGPPR